MNAKPAGPSGTIRLHAVADTILYLPVTAAIGTGLFDAEGLRVEAHVPGPGPGAANAVLTGKADVALGGIWRPAMYVSLGKPLVAFAAIARRAPMFLLARPGLAASAWKGFEGRRLILCGDAPSGWVVLHAQYIAHGVDLGRVRLIPDVHPEEGAELFAAGFGDYIYIGQPWAEELLVTGRAELLTSLAEAAGPLPWSVLMATPAFLSERSSLARRFVRALHNALQWIFRCAPAEIATRMSTAYPRIPSGLLERVVTRYKHLNVWPQSTVIETEDLAAWERLLVAAGLLQGPMDWNLVVNNTFAESVADSNPEASV